MIPQQFQLEMKPLARPEAIVRAPGVRITVLTERLLRLEHDPAEQFVDQASQAIWYREQPVPAFDMERSEEGLTLRTEALTLRYTGRSVTAGFTPDNLQISLNEQKTTWHFGQPDRENLLGTCRTLDQVSGATPLEPGLLSRAGWTVLDDSKTLLFSEDGWLMPRPTSPAARDLYFLGYGLNFKRCLADYSKIAGKTPLLPRWVLGNWWSRFWPYSQAELQGLMAAFREHEVPLSVCIVDMDWHLTNISETVTGWTGYTWNRELFPDPAGFINWLHNQGLHTALNLHPADGIYPHEEQYEAMAARLKHDSSAGAPIRFNIPDPDFTAAYFELLHHPFEAMGVDFWWLDWQQGEVSGLAGLDPLWWLNHLHYYDLGRNGDKRPFIFSRWGGLGNHRYPIGFSGDTVVDWASLAFQPYFTATAANVGYGWWSHDIGGHMFGQEDRELYTRWVQFGVFSPIMRLHSTNNRYHERRPWGYDAEVLRITRDAMQLRHALIPYLYTLSWENATAARSPVRPMYHEYPAADEAYHCPNQYLLGTDLIVAPFLEPADATTGLSRTVVWLPEGQWFDFFDGTAYQGGGWYAIYGALDRIPVFARAGAIVPLGPRVGWGGLGNPAELTVHLFAGANQQFTLYEDDGVSRAYEDGAYSLTNFTQQWSPRQLTLLVEPAGAPAAYLPDERTYHLCIHGVNDPGQVVAAINDEQAFAPYEYDPAREELRLTLRAGSADRLSVSLSMESDKRLWARRDRTLTQCQALLAAFRLPSIAKETLYGQLAQLLQEPASLARFTLSLSEAQKRALLEVSQQAGVHHIRDTRDPDLVILWNNRETSGIQFQYVRQLPDQWNQPYLFRSSQGVVPRFRAIVPRPQANAGRAAAEEAKWQLSLSYWDLLQWRVEG